MKTKLKYLIKIILLILSINVSAQNAVENTNVFVRVYNLQGKKINKGTIISINETSLQLERIGKFKIIPLSSIGLIKTKHTIGNNVLVGAAIGAVTIGAFGVATADPDVFLGHTVGEGALAGAVIGGIAGAGIGGITILLKNSKTYIINGDKAKWKKFKEFTIK